jgi:amidophosphoribosyltransferase
MADNLTIDEMRESIGADSLGFVSLAALTEATTIPAERLCRACFDGKCPVTVAEDEKGKHLLELAGSRGQGRR